MPIPWTQPTERSEGSNPSLPARKRRTCVRRFFVPSAATLLRGCCGFRDALTGLQNRKDRLHPWPGTGAGKSDVHSGRCDQRSSTANCRVHDVAFRPVALLSRGDRGVDSSAFTLDPGVVLPGDSTETWEENKPLYLRGFFVGDAGRVRTVSSGKPALTASSNRSAHLTNDSHCDETRLTGVGVLGATHELYLITHHRKPDTDIR